MKKIILPFALLAFIYTSCKKDDDNIVDPPITTEKKVSWWVINDDTFRTTETQANNYSKYYYLIHQNATNDTTFSIQLDTTGRSLNNDSFELIGVMHGGHSPANAVFNTHYGSHAIDNYDSGTYVYAIREAGKVKLVLPRTLFRRIIQSNGVGVPSEDTTIIQGVFYEP